MVNDCVEGWWWWYWIDVVNDDNEWWEYNTLSILEISVSDGAAVALGDDVFVPIDTIIDDWW